tara:strand:+ start:1828 stop:2172 length:345 start_codon:yes stop_codon:yes gene_type:complete
MVSEEKLEQYREDALRDRYDEERQAWCTHENAYIQEFRVSVHMRKGSYVGQSTREVDDARTTHTSEMFDLEAEHYCPDCGKTKWVHFDLDTEMYYKMRDRWMSVTGESTDVLED